jgi:hypothetical protein
MLQNHFSTLATLFYRSISSWRQNRFSRWRQRADSIPKTRAPMDVADIGIAKHDHGHHPPLERQQRMGFQMSKFNSLLAGGVLQHKREPRKICVVRLLHDTPSRNKTPPRYSIQKQGEKRIDSIVTPQSVPHPPPDCCSKEYHHQLRDK